MKKKYTSLIVKTSALTLLVLVVFSFLLVLVLSVANPRFMAQITYDLGMDKMSLFYYESNYKNTQDVNDLYDLLTISITNKDDDRIIKYYYELENYSRYDEFIAFINNKYLNLNNNSLLKSALYNEDNYLKNKFIEALLNKNKILEALDYATGDFIGYEEFGLNNVGNYLYSNLLNELYVNDTSIRDYLNASLPGTIIPLIRHISIYFNNVYNVFMQEQELTPINKIKLLHIGSRLFVVGSNLINFNTVGNSYITNTEINEKLSEVSGKFSAILG